MLQIAHSLLVGLTCAWQAPAEARTAKEMASSLSRTAKAPAATLYMVPMRDGVKLATDVTLPKGGEDKTWPAILVRTPYNRRGSLGRMLAQIVPNVGYAAVCQDLRGRFDSEGSDFPIHGGCGWQRIQDGYDTIEWVARQPWCNGKVGTIGPSAMGATQNLTLPTRPPHLKCAFVMVAWADIYKHAATWNGAPRRALPEGWIRGNAFDPRNLDLFLSHPDYDEFWQQWNTLALIDRVNVPVLYFGGWYDHFCQGTIDSFVAMQRRGDPKIKKQCRLIMGPWTHDGIPKGMDYPANANPRYDQWILRWCDRHLKGAEAPSDGKARAVNYYVMGASGETNAPGHVWRPVDTWPLPSTDVCYYLGKGGRLSTDKPTDADASATYSYDPLNPVPSIGGGVLTRVTGIRDQRPVEKRADVIVFTTPVLTEPVEATGRIRVKLWASSSCVDTDFTAKLTDVYPDGRSLLVLDGIVRARYRDSISEPEPIVPGKVYALDIDLWSTSIIFNRGHRIRVAVSSSNAPRFRPNANTDDPLDDVSKAVVAKNTIYFDKDRPSHLILPHPTDVAGK